MINNYLYKAFYSSKPDWKNGSQEYHDLLRSYINDSSKVLEIGAGPTNPSTRLLSEISSVVDGIDIDIRIRENADLNKALVYEGLEFPAEIMKNKYDIVTCDYVMEHVENPILMCKEIHSCLNDGGVFIMRTPNIFHYVSIISRFTPQWFHVLVAHGARKNKNMEVEPYPTFYRFNSRKRVTKVLKNSNLKVQRCIMVEKEPSYLKFNGILFFFGVVYERIVNYFGFLSGFRANIFLVATKHEK